LGFLFSYNHRSLFQDGYNNQGETRQSSDTLSSDGYYRLTENLELYGRFALRQSGDGLANLPYVSTLTFLSQARVQYRFARRLDMASEFRWVVQPVSKSRRAGYGAELGFWALSDLRLAAGYNFNGAREAGNNNLLPARGGIYFSISSKLSNLFDLFGTAKSSGSGNSPQPNP
jgi:hypothetical protein